MDRYGHTSYTYNSKKQTLKINFIPSLQTNICGLLGASLMADSKESACNAGDIDSIPGSGEIFFSPGEKNSNALQYSCLENPMDKGTWWATVHGVAKSWTRLSN